LATDEWIKNMIYVYMVEFYLVMKKNEIISFVGKWKELEVIMLREMSHTQK
jgi:hypothetical protein